MMTMCDRDFDPLSSEEPLDIAAVHEDNALLDAIASGDTEAMRAASGVEPDELVEILAAFAATAVVTHLLSGRSDLTDCCRRPTGALPKGDHCTDEPALCTCPEMQP